MRKIHCLNPISKLGTGLLTENYEMTDNLAEAEGILVRSAAMHDLELPKDCVLLHVPERASTTFRLTSVRRLVLSYSIHRAPMQTVSKSWCWLACCWEPET